MGRIAVAGAIATALLSHALAGHDADTIAFFSFKEGADGTSAYGVAITIDVYGALYA